MASAIRPERGTPAQVAWRPQPGPQTALLACPIGDVFFGGARGGGKTDGLLGDFLTQAGRYKRHARGVLFRRSYREIEEVEERARAIYPLLGARENRGKHIWIFPGGATLRMRYLKRDADASNYQGHQYTWMGFDELGNWATPEPIDKLAACLRSPQGVPCVRRSTGNPGGPGHNWIKARYIDPAPPWRPFLMRFRPDPNGSEITMPAVFIPSVLEDNRILVEHDPDYDKRLAMAASAELYKAWRYGDWDIVAGGFFDDVWRRSIHCLAPFPLPASWRLDRAFDWGSTKPFSVGWWAESDGTEATMADGTKRTFPRGTLIRFAEWYGWNGKPNEGCRLVDSEIARRIVEMQKALGYATRILPGPADSSIFDEINSDSPAKIQERLGVRWERADKSPGSRARGWQAMRRRFKAALVDRMEDPGLFTFDTCMHFIRTVPILPRHPVKHDDIDSSSEDHIGDETRYRVLTPQKGFTVGQMDH